MQVKQQQNTLLCCQHRLFHLYKVAGTMLQGPLPLLLQPLKPLLQAQVR